MGPFRLGAFGLDPCVWLPPSLLLHSTSSSPLSLSLKHTSINGSHGPRVSLTYLCSLIATSLTGWCHSCHLLRQIPAGLVNTMDAGRAAQGKVADPKSSSTVSSQTQNTNGPLIQAEKSLQQQASENSLNTTDAREVAEGNAVDSKIPPIAFSQNQDTDRPLNNPEKKWLKEYFGGEYHFLRSYCLSIYEEEDRKEGRSILRARMEADYWSKLHRKSSRNFGCGSKSLYNEDYRWAISVEILAAGAHGSQGQSIQRRNRCLERWYSRIFLALRGDLPAKGAWIWSIVKEPKSIVSEFQIGHSSKTWHWTF